MAKRLPPFHVPKGVPPDIRRALRLGKPGRFLSYEKAYRLADALAESEKEVKRAYSRAIRGLERSRTSPTRSKWLDALKGVQGRYGAIRHASDILERSRGFESLPPLASPDVRPLAITDQKPSAKYFTPEESAWEFEIGVDYSAEVSDVRHDHGRASDVAFNARIYDPAHKPLTESQVREAMDFYASTGELSYRTSRGRHRLKAKAVNWQNWKGAEREGSESDLENFRAILQTVGDGGLRVGGVKPDKM